MKQERKLVTTREVCEWLKVDSATLRRLVRNHGFPAFKLGSKWRYNLEQIEAWAHEQERALAARRKPE